MIKKVLTTILIIFPLILTACASASTTTITTTQTTTVLAIPAQTQIYNDTTYNFSIEFPTGWKQIKESPSDAESTPTYANPHLAIQFIDPTKKVNVAVEVRKLADINESYEQWAQSEIQVTSDYGMTVIQSQPITLSGLPGYETLYTDQVNQEENLCIWTLFDNNIFEVAGSVSLPANYSDYSSLIQEMFNSFKIKNS